jgi:uncharacterized repeat protein (TIGR02543 family)
MKGKKILISVLVIVFVLAAGYAGYYFLFKKDKDGNGNETPKLQQPLTEEEIYALLAKSVSAEEGLTVTSSINMYGEKQNMEYKSSVANGKIKARYQAHNEQTDVIDEVYVGQIQGEYYCIEIEKTGPDYVPATYYYRLTDIQAQIKAQELLGEVLVAYLLNENLVGNLKELAIEAKSYSESFKDLSLEGIRYTDADGEPVNIEISAECYSIKELPNIVNFEMEFDSQERIKNANMTMTPVEEYFPSSLDYQSFGHLLEYNIQIAYGNASFDLPALEGNNTESAQIYISFSNSFSWIEPISGSVFEPGEEVSMDTIVEFADDLPLELEGFYYDRDYKFPIGDTVKLGYKGNFTIVCKWKVPEVTLDLDGGYALPVKDYLCYEDYADLVDPVKTGYSFRGWYLDEGLNQPMPTDSDPITEPITLYAKWVPLVKVEFIVEDLGHKLLPFLGIPNENISYPGSPSTDKAGYILEDWHEDAGLIGPKPLKVGEESIRVYASYRQARAIYIVQSAKYTIPLLPKFINVEKKDDPTEADFNTLISGLNSMVPSGVVGGNDGNYYSFGGWYLDSHCTIPFDNYPVQNYPQSDITLYANFVQVTV